MSHQSIDLYTQYLIDRYVPVVLFLNPDMDILYVHGEVDQYLRFPQALVKFNISKMLSGEVLLLFKNSIQQCIEGEEALYFRNVVFEKAGRNQKAHVRFRKTQLPGFDQQIVLVEILPAEPAEIEVDSEDELAELSNQISFWQEQVKGLEWELKESEQKTQNLIDEQEATNEELKASNRELMSSNEELQSTNEELQSVNEELYTVNSELQLKNEALSTANNDILNLLKSIDIGTIFLDKDLKIRRFTPAVRKHFNLLAIDIGRPISDFSSNLIGLDISKICREVYTTLDKFEKEVEDVNGNHYLLRVLPYRTQEDIIEGLVITFIDVNELTHIRGEMLTFAKKFKAIFQNAEDIILEMNIHGKIEGASNSIGAYSKDALIGKNFFEIIPADIGRDLKAGLGNKSRKNVPLMINFKLGKQDQKKYLYEGTLIPLVENNDNPADDDVNAMLVVLQDVSRAQER